MNKFKFAVNKEGLYSHYGTDGTISFDDVFNKKNQPFGHRHLNGKWVADNEKYKIYLIERIKDKTDIKFKELHEVKALNDSYEYAENYAERKLSIQTQFKELRALCRSLDKKTIEELKRTLEVLNGNS